MADLNNLTSKIQNAIADSEQSAPVRIYKELTNSFAFPGNNDTLQSGWTRKGDGIFFRAKYDEPTYLTFRVEFDLDCIDDYAMAAVGNQIAMYNEMPHPFFNVIMDDVHNPKLGVEEESTNTSTIQNVNVKLSNDDLNLLRQLQPSGSKLKIENDQAPGITSADGCFGKHNVYSTYNYLKYNLGEEQRATMILKLKAMIMDIQKNYPYYFKSIDGLTNLFKIYPKKGIRVAQDNNVITLKCNEALDLRITQILNIYRKIVWDDVYQRWILPDMMRFFKMKIYVYEMRTFHDVQKKGLGEALSKTTGSVPREMAPSSPITDNILLSNSNFELLSSKINELLPTMIFELTQCQFDLSDIFNHIGSLSTSAKDTKSPEPEIKIHVGNVSETHTYNLNKVPWGNVYTDKSLSTEKLYSDEYLHHELDQSRDEYLTNYKSRSSSLNRLGFDLKDERFNYETDRGIVGKIGNTFNKLIVDPIKNEFEQEEMLAKQNTMVGMKVNAPLSSTIRWIGTRNPNILENAINYGVNYGTDYINGKVNEGIEWLLSRPIKDKTLGEILSTAADHATNLKNGNFVFFHEMLKELISDNPAVNTVSMATATPLLVKNNMVK